MLKIELKETDDFTGIVFIGGVGNKEVVITGITPGGLLKFQYLISKYKIEPWCSKKEFLEISNFIILRKIRICKSRNEKNI